jgi:hypothetical protein
VTVSHIDNPDIRPGRYFSYDGSATTQRLIVLVRRKKDGRPLEHIGRHFPAAPNQDATKALDQPGPQRISFHINPCRLQLTRA